MKRKAMPSKKAIKSYWLDVDEYLVMRQNPYSSDESWCFSCGRTRGVERCHIVPHCQGGNESVENLHLLCRSCHFKTEAHGSRDYDFYLHYIKNHIHYMSEWELAIHDWVINKDLHSFQRC